MSAYLNDIQETFIDIASSGYGDFTLEESEWHRKEIKKLFKPLSEDEKAALWKMLKKVMNESDGWFTSDVRYIKKLLKGQR